MATLKTTAKQLAEFIKTSMVLELKSGDLVILTHVKGKLGRFTDYYSDDVIVDKISNIKDIATI